MQGLKKHPYSYVPIIVVAFLMWIKMNQGGRTENWRSGWVTRSESHHLHQLTILMILLLLSQHRTHCRLTSISRGIYKAAEVI